MRSSLLLLVVVVSTSKAQNAIPAEIVIRPENQTTAVYDSTPTLSCVGFGVPLPTITWFWNGVALSNLSPNITINDETQTQNTRDFVISYLEICPLRFGGNYSCRASNTGGTDPAYFQLTVHKSASVTIPPMNQSVIERDTVNLTCTVSGLPLPIVRWTFVHHAGQQVVTNDSSTMIITVPDTINNIVTSNLTLLNVTYSSEGVYECSATNTIGNDNASATLHVFAPPLLLADPDMQAVPIGDTSFSLNCTAHGQPRPHIYWSREGTPITSGMGFNITMSRLNRTTFMSSLHFDRVELYHSGEYACTAESSLTVDSELVFFNVTTKMFNISLLLPSNITIPPLNQSVTEGDTVELTCTVSGPPLPEVEWRFVDDAGEQVITRDSNTLITPMFHDNNMTVTSNLTLLSVPYTREGVYVCSATNTIGNDNASATLHVFAPPLLLADPDTQAVPIGDTSFSLNCTAHGQPRPHIYWSREGTPITSGMGFTITGLPLNRTTFMSRLDFDRVELYHSGEYACTAQNSRTIDSQVEYFNETSKFNISLLLPSNITIPPLNQSVTEGDTVELTCTVSGPPLPEVEWRFVDDAGERVITRDSNTLITPMFHDNNMTMTSNLTLLRVPYSREGVYVCSATNTVGNDSASVKLYVFAPPSINGVLSPVLSVPIDNSSFSVDCVARGQPLPTISWSNGGIPIVSGMKFNITEQPSVVTIMSTLQIYDLQLDDTGEYACTAENSFSNASQTLLPNTDTQEFNISVLASPVIFLHPSPAEEEVVAGTNISRSCVAIGNPRPTIIWLKDEVEVSQNEMFQSQFNATSILHIGPTVSDSAGVYRCRANGTSPDGSIFLTPSNTSEIIFTSPPNIVEMPFDVAIFERMEVTFSCTFESSPLPTSIEWTLRKKGSMPRVPIIHSQRISIENTSSGTNMTSLLTLRASTESDAGEYTCTAFNGITTNLIGARAAGSATLFFRTDDPFLVAEPSTGIFYVGESAILECAGGSTTTLAVTWTKNGETFRLNTSTVPQEQVHTHNVVFSELEDTDNGVYTCTAASQRYRRNVTSRSATLTVFTPVSILESPANTTVNASTTLVWSCLVKGSHDVRVSWWNDSSEVIGDDSRVEITTLPLNNTFHRSNLTIRRVAVTDSASYSCNTHNVLPINDSFTSSDNHSFTLFVQSPPVILSPNGTTVYVLNESIEARLLFIITQDVPPVREDAIHTNFTRYDGIPLSRTPDINGSEISFSIGSVNSEYDEGNYTVFASNAGGSNKKIVYVDVQSPPVMLRLGGYHIAVEGRRVELTCYFLADPRPTVTWQLNGVNINTNQTQRYSAQSTIESEVPIGTYTERLTILSVAERDEGNYTCLVENIHSTVMKSQPLEVIVPPTVTPLERSPIGVETRDGRPSQITVGFTITRADPAVALDNITLTYSNRTHSNMDLPSLAMTDNRFQLSADLLTLTIFNLSYFDAGNITLYATNEAGSVAGTMQLEIHVEPSLLNVTSHVNETLVEGETAVFSCFADGYPLPNIVWLHNGSFVASSSSTRHTEYLSNPTTSPERDYIQAHNSTLEVPRLKLRDAGEYLCRVDPANIDRGTSVLASDTLHLTVLPAPIDYCTPDPCVNGMCSNQSSTYLCTCVPDTRWRGTNCSIEIFEFEAVQVVTDPELNDFPQLFRPVTLTCDVQGSPEPNITWYKDGTLLEGERGRNLEIQEVEISDRGLYWCRGENINRNNHISSHDDSEEVAVNIEGVAQYKAEVIVKRGPLRRRRQSGTEEVNPLNTFFTHLSGLQVDRRNSTILSVTNISEILAEEETPILITLLAAGGGSSELTESLTTRLNSTARAVEGVDLTAPPIRFDGCEEDTTTIPLTTGGLEVVIEWPEADLGEVVTVQCPCGNLSTLSGASNFERMASRRCGGNFTAGAVWDDGVIAACNFSITTRRLCQISNDIDDTEEVISEMDRITRQVENIGIDELGVTTVLIEAVSTNVQQDRNLTEGLFEVVDNLFAVDPESIQESQVESNITARILDVIEQVAQNIPIPENETSSIIQLESFAVAVMDVPSKDAFNGQFFSVSLGKKFTSENPDDLSLDSNDVSFTKETAPTAFLQIDRDFFEDQSVADAISSAGDSRNSSSEAIEEFVPRIINSVYLSDALFPRIGNNNSDVSTTPVGSIILSSILTLTSTITRTTREVRVTNINPPITLTFRKKPSLFNGTNAETTCTYWDFEANKGLGDWSTMNCTLVNNNSDPEAICHCTHFTNFAILLDPTPAKTTHPPPVEKFLNALSYIGVVTSTVCLIITVITYLLSKKLRKSEAGQLLLNLCLGLLGVYILFIISLQATFNKYTCAVASGLLHYFLLVSFFLMTAEALNLFVKLVIVLGIPAIIKNRYVLKASLISWITPLVIVIMSEAPDYNNYVNDEFCRPYDAPFFGGLVVPFVLTYLLNWAFFIAIFIALLRKKDTGKKAEKKSKLRQQFIGTLTLSTLFGLGWGFGLAATSSIPVISIGTIIQAIFIVLSSFQGFLIFIMQCLRSEDARNEWLRWLHIITRNKLRNKNNKPKKLLQSTSDGYQFGSTSLKPKTVSTVAPIKFQRHSKEEFSNFTFGRPTPLSSPVKTDDEVEKMTFEMFVRSENKQQPSIQEDETSETSDDNACIEDEAFQPTNDDSFLAEFIADDAIDFVPFDPNADLPNAKLNPMYEYLPSETVPTDINGDIESGLYLDSATTDPNESSLLDSASMSQLDSSAYLDKDSANPDAIDEFDSNDDDLASLYGDSTDELAPFDFSTLRFTSPYNVFTKNRNEPSPEKKFATDNEMILLGNEAMSDEEKRASAWGDATDVMASFTADDFLTSKESDVFY